MTFKNHYNRDKFPDTGEVNDQPSETVPDQSMSIPEILRRYAAGLHIGGSRNPIYEGDDDDILGGVDPRKLDLSEREQLKRDLREELENLQRKFSESNYNKQQNTNKDEQTPNNKYTGLEQEMQSIVPAPPARSAE